MNTVDWIGFSGVALLLAAYFLASFKMIRPGGLPYIILNCTGAAVACFAAVLLHYIPFIILEGAWFVIAVVSLVKLKSK
ncbi:MAG: hypothetical protein KDD04_02950 [Sinomicrobium sp.]|nr:hypothetical protein [Sinomicrobium sp.]